MLDADAIYQQYRDTVCGYLCQLCHDRDLADELTQETFYQAMRRWNSFRGQSSIGTWLCAIARNQYCLALRKPRPVSLEDAPEPATPDFSEQIANRGLAFSAYKALHRLPEPYREVFSLRTFCDLSHKEVAELFGKSESWARVTCYRAKQMLMDAMKGENTDEEGM